MIHLTTKRHVLPMLPVSSERASKGNCLETWCQSPVTEIPDAIAEVPEARAVLIRAGWPRPLPMATWHLGDAGSPARAAACSPIEKFRYISCRKRRRQGRRSQFFMTVNGSAGEWSDVCR